MDPDHLHHPSSSSSHQQQQQQQDQQSVQADGTSPAPYTRTEQRGRKRNNDLPPSRAREVQRAFRARRAAHLAALEARVKEIESENAELRELLHMPPANRPAIRSGPTGRGKLIDVGASNSPSSSRLDDQYSHSDSGSPGSEEHFSHANNGNGYEDSRQGRGRKRYSVDPASSRNPSSGGSQSFSPLTREGSFGIHQRASSRPPGGAVPGMGPYGGLFSGGLGNNNSQLGLNADARFSSFLNNTSLNAPSPSAGSSSSGVPRLEDIFQYQQLVQQQAGSSQLNQPTQQQLSQLSLDLNDLYPPLYGGNGNSNESRSSSHNRTSSPSSRLGVSSGVGFPSGHSNYLASFGSGFAPSPNSFRSPYGSTPSSNVPANNNNNISNTNGADPAFPFHKPVLHGPAQTLSVMDRLRACCKLDDKLVAADPGLLAFCNDILAAVNALPSDAEPGVTAQSNGLDDDRSNPPRPFLPIRQAWQILRTHFPLPFDPAVRDAMAAGTRAAAVLLHTSAAAEKHRLMQDGVIKPEPSLTSGPRAFGEFIVCRNKNGIEVDQGLLVELVVRLEEGARQAASQPPRGNQPSHLQPHQNQQSQHSQQQQLPSHQHQTSLNQTHSPAQSDSSMGKQSDSPNVGGSSAQPRHPSHLASEVMADRQQQQQGDVIIPGSSEGQQALGNHNGNEIGNGTNSPGVSL
ncbi:bzip transcription factor [Phaffia rhodozyma]|uniref:Bzip transcription factor n=1 Tax=Phaffia rhodozyma TaxID=264483 RepID=A0A0F7SEZ2_PHARH|nr:bzip transcription factor [Phaffia rhodozyma]